MKLRELLRDVPVRATHGDLDVEISAVQAELIRQGVRIS